MIDHQLLDALAQCQSEEFTALDGRKGRWCRGCGYRPLFGEQTICGCGFDNGPRQKAEAK